MFWIRNDAFEPVDRLEHLFRHLAGSLYRRVPVEVLRAGEKNLQGLAQMMGGGAGHFEHALEALLFFYGADVHEGFQEVAAAGKRYFLDGFENGDLLARPVEHAAFGMVDFLAKIRDGALPCGDRANEVVADMADHVLQRPADQRRGLGVDIDDTMSLGVDDDRPQQ